jgi:adenosylmethionine-8-amino-7-oxononanoate aminotransferase
VSLGHIGLFHKAYNGLLFRSDSVPAPYCYRCPYNRAKPQRADAREYRKCNWECVAKVEMQFHAQNQKGSSYAGFVVEPLIQGAAGMIAQPEGWLKRVGEIARNHGSLLIADEVMTGFGRTGVPARGASLFASHHQTVQPDLMALAKGMTGGYLPMAATLVAQPIFDAFLGDYAEFKTFFHGHSYTANQLGAAASLASLDVLQSPESIQQRIALQKALQENLGRLWDLPQVGDIRQVGLAAGIELVDDWRTRAPFPLEQRAGIRVCEAMARRGVLTRPIGNVIVIMPPYCTTPAQVERIISVLGESVSEVFGERPYSRKARRLEREKA